MYLTIFSPSVINGKLFCSKFFYIPIVVIAEVYRFGTRIIETPSSGDTVFIHFPISVNTYKLSYIRAVFLQFIYGIVCIAYIIDYLHTRPCIITYQGYGIFFSIRIISRFLNATGCKNQSYKNDKNRFLH